MEERETRESKNRKKSGRRRKGGPVKQPEEVIAERRTKLEQRQLLLGFIVKLAAIGLAVWVVFTFFFGLAPTQGESMYPRIRDGDLVLFYRIERTYHIGDVVTLKREGERYMGRIVAMGGDIVDITDDGGLLVNGNLQQEDTVYPTYASENGIPLPCSVGEGEAFILCDLRTSGTDSRDFGPVTISELDGKVISLLRRRGI